MQKDICARIFREILGFPGQKRLDAIIPSFALKPESSLGRLCAAKIEVMNEFSPARVVERAIANIKLSAARNVISAVLFAIIGALAVGLPLLAAGASVFDSLKELTNPDMSSEQTNKALEHLVHSAGAAIGFVILAGIAYAVVLVWAQLTMVGNAIEVERPEVERRTLGMVFMQALRALPALVLLSIVLWIGAAIAAAVVIGLPLLIAAVVGNQALYLLCLLIAIVGYVVIVLGAATISMPMIGAAYEGAGFETLSIAWRLVKGRMLRVIGALLLVALVNFAITIGLAIVVAICSAAGNAGAVLGGIVYVIGLIGIFLLSISANAVIYLELKGVAPFRPVLPMIPGQPQTSLQPQAPMSPGASTFAESFGIESPAPEPGLDPQTDDLGPIDPK